MPFKLLQQVALQVCARGDVEHIEQGHECRMMFSRVFFAREIFGALEQVFEPQQGANALIKRVLVQYQIVSTPTGRFMP